MVGESSLSQNARSWRWPVVISLLIACLCAGLLWQIIASPPQSADAAKMQQYKALQLELTMLQGLENKDPCVVAKALELSLPKPSGEKGSSNEKSAPESEKPVDDAEKIADAAKKGDVAPTIPAAQIENATVLVIGANASGAISMGTGFFVTPTMIATNRHVIESGTSHVIVNKALGTLVPVKIKAISPNKQRDYAILEYTGTLPAAIKPLPLELSIDKTDKVHAWGYPAAVTQNDPQYHALLKGNVKAIPEIIYSEGVVSAIMQRSPDVIVHTTPISPGNSGGPLLNKRGHVVGINTLISLDDDSYRQTSLSLTSSDLLNFLQSAGVNPQVLVKGGSK